MSSIELIPSPKPLQASPLIIIKSFEKIATEHSSKTAIITEANRQITFAQLNSRASNLAQFIQYIANVNAISLSPLITIMMERDIGILVAMLSILKLGFAYIPVDPSFPPERHAYILR